MALLLIATTPWELAYNMGSTPEGGRQHTITTHVCPPTAWGEDLARRTARQWRPVLQAPRTCGKHGLWSQTAAQHPTDATSADSSGKGSISRLTSMRTREHTRTHARERTADSNRQRQQTKQNSSKQNIAVKHARHASAQHTATSHSSRQRQQQTPKAKGKGGWEKRRFELTVKQMARGRQRIEQYSPHAE